MSILTVRSAGLVIGLVGALGHVSAQAPAALSDADRSAIQELVTRYAQALGGCKAQDFADLFVPGTGYFASGFRGVMVGHERLVKLVESERQCVAPNAKAAPKAGGAAGPTVVFDLSGNQVRGVATVTGAEYQDEYAKTSSGWKFASRSVLTAGEKAAGLDAQGILAIQKLGGEKLGDHYEADQNGVQRLMNSGVKVTASATQVTGRAYFADGSYADQVYEKLPSGEWRVKSTSAPAR